MLIIFDHLLFIIKNIIISIFINVGNINMTNLFIIYFARKYLDRIYTSPCHVIDDSSKRKIRKFETQVID